MNVGKSLTYIFDDPRWLNKVGIGTLIALLSGVLSVVLIGILGFLIMAGYGLEVLRNVRRGDPDPMPEWQTDKLGEWLMQGLRVGVASLIWALPALLVALPLIAGSAMVDNNSDLSTIGGLLIACFGCLLFVWSVLTALVSPAIYIRVAEEETVASGLRFREIIQFTRDHLGEVIVAVLVSFFASLIVGLIAILLSAITCGVGAIILLPASQFIITLIQMHLYGQIGRGRTADDYSPRLPKPDQPLAPVAPSTDVTYTPTAVTWPETPAVTFEDPQAEVVFSKDAPAIDAGPATPVVFEEPAAYDAYGEPWMPNDDPDKAVG